MFLLLGSLYQILSYQNLLVYGKVEHCSFFSFCHPGVLQEMEAYIRGLIPNLAQLRDMPPAFIQMYCRIAAHKFFFFCDPHRRGL